MKFIEKIAKKFTKTASSAAKCELKKTAIDLLPTIAGVVSMIVGIVIFREVVEAPEEIRPSVSNTSVTTNNYFFRDMSEEAIHRILEEGDR